MQPSLGLPDQDQKQFRSDLFGRCEDFLQRRHEYIFSRCRNAKSLFDRPFEIRSLGYQYSLCNTVKMVNGKFIVPQGVSRPRDRAGCNQTCNEMRCWMI